MDLRPTDVIFDHFYYGPGNGSSWKATHQPTGVFVSERVPVDSKESGRAVQRRLLASLALKLQDDRHQ